VEYAWWQRAAGNRLSLGLSDSEVSRNTAFLQRVVRRLKQYSEWSLDPDLLEESLEDMSVLQQRRAERAVLFMDIRDFTHWSEDKDPEMVIGMLNGFYDLAERIVMSGGGHKPHFTGDEVMSWFDDPMLAVEAARVLRIEATALLRRHQLNSGGALHLGPVVEGLMGSTGTRRYGIVGDTVNTTARLCDAARPGEVSISEALARRLAMVSKLGPARTIQAKGKQEPLVAYPL
jgi:class 3 adenylate cyclase